MICSLVCVARVWTGFGLVVWSGIVRSGVGWMPDPGAVAAHPAASNVTPASTETIQRFIPVDIGKQGAEP
jgi:hypothetical protein